MKTKVCSLSFGRGTRMLLLSLFLLILIALQAYGATPGQRLWVRRYNGPGNSGDGANAIAVDSSGNVYVTGGSRGSGTSADYATIKYDSAGNMKWVGRYDGPGHGDDVATAIAVDKSGNVYITGWSTGSGTWVDYATIKYDSAGNRLWVRRYNGPGNGRDEANAIAVDASGNVYVTGLSDGFGWTGYDFATIKYNSAGNKVWLRRYNGPGSGSDIARAIAVDSSGNVYVTGQGRLSGPGTDHDYATIKYDSAGNRKWVKWYNGPADEEDTASAIAIGGGIYVTGTVDSGNWYDYATIKYDSAGNQMWVKPYDGPANGAEGATAIAVDSSGNVYVTGYSYGSGTSYDYATIKYDSAGNVKWVRRYNGPGNGLDVAWDITVDSSGNVYVTGYSLGSGTSYDYATIKYDAAGKVKWLRRYNGPGNDRDEATAIAVDKSGNAYVTGQSLGSGSSYDYATIKYAP